MKLDNLSPGDLYGDTKLTIKQAISETQADFSEPSPVYQAPIRTPGSIILGILKVLSVILAILCLIILPQLDMPSEGIGIAGIFILVRVIIRLVQKSNNNSKK